MIVMHDGDVEFAFESLFDLEAFGCLYILQVDATKGGRDCLHHLDEFFRVFFIYFNIEHIDTGKYLEEQSFTFHHRLPGKGPDIPQTQHSSAVGDDRHQVAFRGVVVSVLRVFFNLEAGFGYTG